MKQKFVSTYQKVFKQMAVGQRGYLLCLKTRYSSLVIAAKNHSPDEIRAKAREEYWSNAY